MYKRYIQRCIKVGARKGPQAGEYEDGTVRSLTVARPAVLSYTFTKCHRWETLGRECVRSISFRATACESAIISKLVSCRSDIKPQASINTELHWTLPRPLQPPQAVTGNGKKTQRERKGSLLFSRPPSLSTCCCHPPTQSARGPSSPFHCTRGKFMGSFDINKH